jgi:[NiFe] hydrogenase assembly HybE family chaperone
MAANQQATLTDRIERHFEQIHRERMAGLPILNPALAVRLVGLRTWRDGWVGVLVTPWTMNLIALPGPGCADRPGSVGTKRERDFPSGRYEFVAGADPEIGPHETCSLVSPMDAFADQGGAQSTAEAILTLLFDPAPSRPLTRRGLFRIALGGGD